MFTGFKLASQLVVVLGAFKHGPVEDAAAEDSLNRYHIPGAFFFDKKRKECQFVFILTFIFLGGLLSFAASFDK